MTRRRSKPKGKKINPHYWVFCEGKTEEKYVKLLRSKYRLPIEIVTKVAGSDISEKFIKNFKKGKPYDNKIDKNFLIYDGDVLEMNKKLKEIKSAKLIMSTPSIELWFLLHYRNQKNAISEKECIKELSKVNGIYKKGVIDNNLRLVLDENYNEASNRAKKLVLFKNPSTNMYEFIEVLIENKK